VNPWDFPGLVGGVAGTWLFLAGLLVSVGAALRVAFVLRRPDAGRVARGVVAGGGVVATAGILLFGGAQASPWRAAFDRATPYVGLAAVLAAVAVARAVARRRP
jgi:hypothetical protein